MKIELKLMLKDNWIDNIMDLNIAHEVLYSSIYLKGIKIPVRIQTIGWKWIAIVEQIQWQI